MAPSALEIKSDMLIARRAKLECELRDVRMKLKEVAVDLARERRAQAKKEREEKEKKVAAVKEKVKKSMLKKTERFSLRICKENRWMVGWSRDGKTRYGPGYVCWQCEHRANGKLGGHRHSCGKVPYAR